MAQQSVYACRVWPDGHITTWDCSYLTSSWRSSAHPNLPSVHLLPDNTRRNTWQFDISLSFPFQIRFNTMQLLNIHGQRMDTWIVLIHLILVEILGWMGGWFVTRLGVWRTCDVCTHLDKKLGKMGKNAIQFDCHGGRCHHTAAMGPHSQQQSIQQSTHMICNRSTLLKLEKKILLLIWLLLHIASTARMQQQSSPLCCCLPHHAASLAYLVLSCPLQRFLACVPLVSRDVSLLTSLALSGPLHHRLASLASSHVGNEDAPGHKYQQ